MLAHLGAAARRLSSSAGQRSPGPTGAARPRSRHSAQPRGAPPARPTPRGLHCPVALRWERPLLKKKAPILTPNFYRGLFPLRRGGLLAPSRTMSPHTRAGVQPCREPAAAPRHSVPAGLSPSPSAQCSWLPPTNAAGCRDRSVHAAPGGSCVIGCQRTRASGWPPEGCRGQGQRGDDKLERDLVLATGARERAFLNSVYLSINVRKNSKKTEVGSRT